MLAHRAMAQGEMVAELISGKSREFNPAAIPAVCFTDPELVVVGKTPDEAKAAGLDCIVSSFPFAANGRAMTLESKTGFVRVVARRDNHLIVGWQAVGVGVSELSTAFGLSLEMGASGRCGRHHPCSPDARRSCTRGGFKSLGPRAAPVNPR